MLVVAEQEVRIAVADVAAAVRFHDIDVDAVPVNVAHKQFAVILFRPRSTLITQQPTVRVTATETTADRVPRPLVRALPVPVRGNRFDVVVGVRVEVLPRLALVAATLHDVPEVRNHAGFDEEIAVRIVVQPPRVRGALREDFKRMPRRMISPDARVDRRALRVLRAGSADVRVREHAVATVQPAIRTPDETVKGFVRVLVAETIEENFRLARLVVRIGGDEQHVRRSPDPDAAEAILDARDEVQAFKEDGLFVELAIAVSVLED